MDRVLRLLQTVNASEGLQSALDAITAAALEWTESRNAMIALLNEEVGVLELTSGAGAEWSEALQDEAIPVTKSEGIVAYVAATGRPLRAADVENEPHYVPLFESTKSEAAVPVRDRHGLLRAVLNVESDQTGHYPAEKELLMKVLAEITAMAVERDDACMREDALVEIGHALDRAMTEEAVVQGVIRIAGEVLRFQAFGVFLLDSDADRYVLRGAVGRLKERIGEIGVVRGEGITGWVAETLRPWLTHDPANDPRWSDRNNEIPGDQMASFLAVPVVHRGRCLAVLRGIRKVSDNKYLDNRFTESDMRVLTAIAEQMATALESIRAVRRLVRSEKMAAWGELSAKSSHMIGNRVFALKGDVNELRHVLGESQPNLKALGDLQRSLEVNVRRVEEILQDFRDFLSATQVAPEAGDLNELVDTTVREVFPRRTEIALEVQLETDLPHAMIDAKRLQRAISELIENATNYMADGILTVRTRVATEEEASTKKLPTSIGYAAIEVQDSGPGVENERKELIFQPFHSGRVKGMGLGLSIVRGIAESHGGAAYEDGIPGGGAKFVILLPLADRS